MRLKDILPKEIVLNYEDERFKSYVNSIIHSWSKILTALVFILYPVFYILDIFTMPGYLLPKFAVYRTITTLAAVSQFLILKKTIPGKLSYIHGYIVTIIAGGFITLMTIDLGGFDSRYYAGLNLVIIAVNVLLPWHPLHSLFNGLITTLMYVFLNIFFIHVFNTTHMINNLFFMMSTVIIAISITQVRHNLIKKEYFLRSELRRARDALFSEMQIAKKIQTGLLPKDTTLNNYEIIARMIPADEVGGDYYDILETASGEQWIAIGDVSGHGVASGLIMMMTQTSIFTIVNKSSGCSPAKVLEDVNTIICKNIQRLGINRYMTINAIKLEESQLTIAGKHQDIIMYRENSNTTEVIQTDGTWLGLTDNIQGFLKNSTVNINTGDIMLLFSDGITEAMNLYGELYGYHRLIDALMKYADLPLNNLVNSILHDVISYQDKQLDDITLIAIKKIK